MAEHSLVSLWYDLFLEFLLRPPYSVHAARYATTCGVSRALWVVVLPNIVSDYICVPHNLRHLN